EAGGAFDPVGVLGVAAGVEGAGLGLQFAAGGVFDVHHDAGVVPGHGAGLEVGDAHAQGEFEGFDSGGEGDQAVAHDRLAGLGAGQAEEAVAVLVLAPGAGAPIGGAVAFLGGGFEVAVGDDGFAGFEGGGDLGLAGGGLAVELGLA